MVLLLHVQLWMQVDEVEQPHISARAELQLTPSVDLGTWRLWCQCGISSRLPSVTSMGADGFQMYPKKPETNRNIWSRSAKLNDFVKTSRNPNLQIKTCKIIRCYKAQRIWSWLKKTWKHLFSEPCRHIHKCSTEFGMSQGNSLASTQLEEYAMPQVWAHFREVVFIFPDMDWCSCRPQFLWCF